MFGHHSRCNSILLLSWLWDGKLIEAGKQWNPKTLIYLPQIFDDFGLSYTPKLLPVNIKMEKQSLTVC